SSVRSAAAFRPALETSSLAGRRGAPFPLNLLEHPVRTAQAGDRVLVHYVKRLQDGSVASSRGRAPLELTVGVGHPRLPGLGAALVGLAPGASATVTVPAGIAYGPVDPARVRRWPRTRFSTDAPLPIDGWVRAVSRRGGSRLVRILEVRDDAVVV